MRVFLNNQHNIYYQTNYPIKYPQNLRILRVTNKDKHRLIFDHQLGGTDDLSFKVILYYMLTELLSISVSLRWKFEFQIKVIFI